MWQAHGDSNPDDNDTVLETAALPVELWTFTAQGRKVAIAGQDWAGDAERSWDPSYRHATQRACARWRIGGRDREN